MTIPRIAGPACLLTFWGASAAPPPGPQTVPAPSEPVRTLPYSTGAGPRELQLRRLLPDVDSLDDALLEKFRKAKPMDPRPGSLAFALVDCPAGKPEKGRLVFLTYRGKNWVWVGDIVREPDGRHACVLLAESANAASAVSTVWLYRIDCSKSSGAWPLVLDKRDCAKWPEESHEARELVRLNNLSREGSEYGAVRGFRAVLDGDGLNIYADCFEPTAQPLQYRYNPKTKELFRTTLAERKLSPVKKGGN